VRLLWKLQEQISLALPRLVESVRYSAVYEDFIRIFFIRKNPRESLAKNFPIAPKIWN